MLFHSTQNKETATLRDAVLKGLAPDGGLFMPTSIPRLSEIVINNLPNLSLPEMAIEISTAFLNETLTKLEISKLVTETLNFQMPLVEVEPNLYSLELFHGPTMAFKDVGARFMSRLMAKFSAGKNIKVIVATSGDTGSAVAAGFYDVPGIEVYILYPQGKVSPLQEKQLTTWGNNITALEIKGTFDDCQSLAKQLLKDAELNKHFTLTSANSINIGRLIPQTFYYFWAYAQLKHLGKPLVISVPSGNFGNLTAGLLAKKMGLPIDHFVASTNSNKVFLQYMESGVYKAQPSLNTISNAMDVGNPSNFERITSLFDEDIDELKKHLSAYHFDDDETKDSMRKVYKEFNYLLDPHGAVGYLGLKKYQNFSTDVVGVFLETAHPSKFVEVVEETLSINLPIPEKLLSFNNKLKKTIVFKPDLDSIKKFIGKEVSQ